jgi:signal transduction histidine kinase
VIVGDSMSIFYPELMIGWKKAVFISEAVMVSAWLLFTLSYASTVNWHTINKFSRLLLCLSPLFIIFLITIPMEDFFYSPEFESEKTLFLSNAGYIFNLLLLFYSIVSIINLEATLKGSSGTYRWQIKYTILGVGGILAMNIFYYSHALLYRSINMYLLPVRAGIILISILLIGFSLLRHQDMDIKLAVSRKVLYRSLSLIIVGIYLLGLGLIGEGMRYFGPGVGENIAIFLGFVGAILVLTVILSEQLRRKAIVLINKNFYSQKYDYREQWLQFTQRISLKHSFEELISSIKDIVTLSEEFIKKTGASLIVPLLNIDDLIGFIILGAGLADDEYDYEDYDMLKTLAKQTTAAIINARLSEELIEAKEMEAMGRLSSFILHDLKNATSMLSLIVQNAEEHIDNPDFQKDAIKAVSNTSEKIKGLIGKLKYLPKKTDLDIEYSDLGSHIEMAIQQLNMNGSERLSYKELEPVKTEFDREEITKVIINLIINALEATNNQGDIEVVVGTEENMGFVKVSDNGCGMSSEFVEKSLFKPFQTTKKKGLGIGLYQCKAIVEAHSGKLKVVSQEGKGTDFFLYLPLTRH